MAHQSSHLLSNTAVLVRKFVEVRAFLVFIETLVLLRKSLSWSITKARSKFLNDFVFWFRKKSDLRWCVLSLGFSFSSCNDQVKALEMFDLRNKPDVDLQNIKTTSTVGIDLLIYLITIKCQVPSRLQIR